MKGKRIERRIPRIIVTLEMQWRTDQAQYVLHRDQMAHFLLCDAEDGFLPNAHGIVKSWRHLRAAQRIGGI
ncbi:hypothetical protein WM31_28510 [Burkholderia ubonensis]|nr:hypothetical protein WM31_28510 [Burkholderia ubonensis]